MPRLGHAARIRAHMRQIRKDVQSVLDVAEQGQSLEKTIADINAIDGLAWKYRKAYGNNCHSDYRTLVCATVDILVKGHTEIISFLDKWKESDPEYEIDKAAGQIKDLAIMAWLIERKARGQESESDYLTLDVDPITIRLLAYIQDEQEKREGDERVLIIENALIAPALRADERENLRKARKALQHMMKDGDDENMIRMECQINSSDIKDLRSISITIENGSVRSSIGFWDKSPIIYITDGSIMLNLRVPYAQSAGLVGKALRYAIQHPFLDGLGLMIQEVEEKKTGDGDMSSIRSDACDRGRLTAMVMNMKRKAA